MDISRSADTLSEDYQEAIKQRTVSQGRDQTEMKNAKTEKETIYLGFSFSGRIVGFVLSRSKLKYSMFYNEEKSYHGTSSNIKLSQ